MFAVSRHLLNEAREGWLLGSEAFLERIKTLLSTSQQLDQVPQARSLACLSVTQVILIVASHFGTSPDLYQIRRSTTPGRNLAAWLAHRRTTATLRDLATAFGFSHPDSVSNIIRRAETAIQGSAKFAKEAEQATRLLEKQ